MMILRAEWERLPETQLVILGNALRRETLGEAVQQRGAVVGVRRITLRGAQGLSGIG